MAAGKTLVVVSHDAAMIRELCTRAVVIRRGEVVFDGGIDEAIALLED